MRAGRFSAGPVNAGRQVFSRPCQQSQRPAHAQAGFQQDPSTVARPPAPVQEGLPQQDPSKAPAAVNAGHVQQASSTHSPMLTNGLATMLAMILAASAESVQATYVEMQSVMDLARRSGNACTVKVEGHEDAGPPMTATAVPAAAPLPPVQTTAVAPAPPAPAQAMAIAPAPPAGIVWSAGPVFGSQWGQPHIQESTACSSVFARITRPASVEWRVYQAYGFRPLLEGRLQLDLLDHEPLITLHITVFYSFPLFPRSHTPNFTFPPRNPECPLLIRGSCAALECALRYKKQREETDEDAGD